MSQATRCDAPACDAFTRTLLDGWVEVVQLPSTRQGEDMLHFCSWDCVLAFAATKEPMTHIQPRL